MKTQEKNKKQTKGITLIALVITIVILLILAGVSINLVLGPNGLIAKAQEAALKTEEANTKEQVQIAVTGSIGINGKLENEKLKENLNLIENISGVPEEITDESYPITVTVDGKYSYLINKDGIIEEVVKRLGIEVGDYIDYTYDIKTEGYNLLASESGYDSNQTISQKSGMKWRILNIHADGTVDLIGDISSSDQTIYFKGALGYNNGVFLLNDICKELYSNDTLGIIARSVNLEDIESQMNATGIAARNTYSNEITYKESKTYTGNYSNYPNLYAQENGSGINTEKTKTDGIGVSNNGYTSLTKETSTKVDSLTVTQSYYYFSDTPSSYFKDYDGSSSTVGDMIFNTGTYYWLSSRFATCESTRANFGLRRVNSSALGGNGVFGSSGATYSEDNRIRPIVSLESDIKITPCEGENSIRNMHKISKQ